ncbi:hypothetical protein HZH68_002102 [Vespula germanica]|uniref:Uncharacterized protein n=1 Tax=Vespula germanica TaxID=30212 RepID=A0A834NM45_VESGE|nr:hypothetical protein HZH68_002102 [Vespula germanica]
MARYRNYEEAELTGRGEGGDGGGGGGSGGGDGDGDGGFKDNQQVRSSGGKEGFRREVYGKPNASACTWLYCFSGRSGQLSLSVVVADAAAAVAVAATAAIAIAIAAFLLRCPVP